MGLAETYGLPNWRLGLAVSMDMPTVCISSSETPRQNRIGLLNRGLNFSAWDSRGGNIYILDAGRPVSFGLVKHTGTKAAGQHITHVLRVVG